MLQLKAETVISQIPKLPFDVLFQVVDEEFAAAETPQARGVVFKTFATTCPELAIHGRALLFRVVYLQLDFDDGVNSSTNLKQSPAGRFANLIRCYPHNLDLVRHLSLGLHQSWPHTQDRLLDVVTRQALSRRRERLDIMAASYPNLKVLTLACSYWRTLHREVKEAVIKMLLQTQRLEILILNIGRCPSSILQYCPPTVKHLSFVGHCAGEKLPINPPARNRPRVEGFVWAADGSSVMEKSWSLQMASMLELQSLEHLELWSANGVTGFNTFGPIITPASATLRCLHLLGPNVTVYLNMYPHLVLGSLGALQLFEVGINVTMLKSSLQWVSESIATIPLQRRAADSGGMTLIVCIQAPGYIPNYWPSADGAHEHTLNHWMDIQADDWPYIHQIANVYAFSEDRIICTVPEAAARSASLLLKWSLYEDRPKLLPRLISMLQRLKIKSIQHPPDKLILQDPKLPFEILFQIIDEGLNDAETPHTRTAVLTSFGRTCKELAIYCRAILFRSVHLSPQFHSGIKLSGEIKQSAAGRFADLARCYPRDLDLVQHLSLDLHQSWHRKRDKLLNALAHYGAVGRREWLGVVAASYPNLRVLRLNCSFWPDLYQEGKEAFIKMLVKAEHLEILGLDIVGSPPDILQYCPPTVKHLEYAGDFRRSGNVSICPPARDRPRLEGLKYVGDDRSALQDWASHLVPSIVSEQKQLNHMELWSPYGLQAFAPGFGTLIQQVSSTLQCLHLIGFGTTVVEEPLPSLDLGSLCVLRLFEVGFDVVTMREGLQWISKSVATIPSSPCPDDSDINGITLIICVQDSTFHFLWPSIELVHCYMSDVWKASQADWSIICHKASIYAFSECITRYGKRLAEPRPLLSSRPGTSSHSILLKRICTCLEI
ncbi:hypothetical protein BKA70DRAFT_1418687 [Coprinopsis sp. MPI-PUGE-AT-0042]|nr:hypothetical protein BKA70DRAFT_1418687 [Coprinopsis sp. MPI-PUGE-AT-0042]